MEDLCRGSARPVRDDRAALLQRAGPRARRDRAHHAARWTPAATPTSCSPSTTSPPTTPSPCCGAPTRYPHLRVDAVPPQRRLGHRPPDRHPGRPRPDRGLDRRRHDLPERAHPRARPLPGRPPRRRPGRRRAHHRAGHPQAPAGAGEVGHPQDRRVAGRDQDPRPQLRAAGVPARASRCPTCGCCRPGSPASPRSRCRSCPTSTASTTCRSTTRSGPGMSKFHPFKDAYRYILQVLRMVMYFNPLKVLMPLALWLLGIGIVKGIFDLVALPLPHDHQHGAAVRHRSAHRRGRRCWPTSSSAPARTDRRADRGGRTDPPAHRGDRAPRHGAGTPAPGRRPRCGPHHLVRAVPGLAAPRHAAGAGRSPRGSHLPEGHRSARLVAA